jgi:hypothetical protein
MHPELTELSSLRARLQLFPITGVAVGLCLRKRRKTPTAAAGFSTHNTKPGQRCIIPSMVIMGEAGL